MMNFVDRFKTILAFVVVMVISQGKSDAQNPIIRNQFSADPTARVFNGKVFLFPSHDILAVEGKGRPGWFCMADYHVFSSNNLTQWVDHGVVVSQNKVNWVDSTSYSMWAPDCVERNGKYYFYFPANNRFADPVSGRKGFSIGVAVADKPEGPYVPLSEPIKNVRGIDPNVLIDKDGQAYLYWSMQNIYVAKLKDNMIELDSEPQIIANLPEKGLKEGPFVFERNGLYYLTFPHVENKIERLEYAIGNHPMGPFKMTGVIMDESPMNCWTNHHSLMQYNNQWFLFYHQNGYSPNFDKNRSVCIDSVFFNTDGTIQKVVPTYRGVGVTMASDTIEIDRYSSKSDEGVEVALKDSTNSFIGWKCNLKNKGAWIQYNSVDLGTNKISNAILRTKSNKGGRLLLRLNDNNGTIVATMNIPASEKWVDVECDVRKIIPGIHNVVLSLKSSDAVEVDWLRFK
jgi:hypothetical protein